MTTKVAVEGFDGLSPTQIKTLEHVATAKTLAEAARKAGVNRTTLTKWMATPEFRDALSTIFQSRFEGLNAEAIRLATKGFATLEATMDDPTSPPWLRARVASDLVNFALRIHEQTGLSMKIDTLAMRLEALNA